MDKSLFSSSILKYKLENMFMNTIPPNIYWLLKKVLPIMYKSDRDKTQPSSNVDKLVPIKMPIFKKEEFINNKFNIYAQKLIG